MRQRRRVLDQAGSKGGDRLGQAFDLDKHTAAVVADEAGQPVFQRQTIDKRAEADTLNDAGDGQALAGAGSSGDTSRDQAGSRHPCLDWRSHHAGERATGETAKSSSQASQASIP